MPKQIKRFLMAGQEGDPFAIDLTDARYATVVNPSDGNIVFFEGEGEDRLTDVCLPGSAVIGFVARTNGRPDALEVAVRYREGDEEGEWVLGFSTAKASARSWVDTVDAIYNKKQTAAQ